VWFPRGKPLDAGLDQGEQPVGEVVICARAATAFERVADQRPQHLNLADHPGRRLIAVKATCGHGEWLRWLEREFGWSEPTAQRFMRVAERFGNTSGLTGLDITREALYLLAGPTVPEAAREAAVTAAEAGEHVTRPYGGSLYRIAARRATLATVDVARGARVKLAISDETMTNRGTARRSMWNISSSLADRLFLISNIVLMIGAGAVFISATATSRNSRPYAPWRRTAAAIGARRGGAPRLANG
jgi:hypothetical protein